MQEYRGRQLSAFKVSPIWEEKVLCPRERAEPEGWGGNTHCAEASCSRHVPEFVPCRFSPMTHLAKQKLWQGIKWSSGKEPVLGSHRNDTPSLFFFLISNASLLKYSASSRWEEEFPRVGRPETHTTFPGYPTRKHADRKEIFGCGSD